MAHSELDHGAGQHYERGHVRPYCDNCEGRLRSFCFSQCFLRELVINPAVLALKDLEIAGDLEHCVVSSLKRNLLIAQ